MRILSRQSATQGHLGVTNHQGVPEQYELKLLVNGKVARHLAYHA